MSAALQQPLPWCRSLSGPLRAGPRIALGGLTFGHVSRDVRALIRDPANADAVFQVASQVGNLSVSCAIIRRLMSGLMQGRHTLSFVDVRFIANNKNPGNNTVRTSSMFSPRLL